MIAFIGSVFSPYYAWSGRHDPENHAALNVALYGPRANRWAMTERPREAVCRDAEAFTVGPSRLAWHDDARLVIDIRERGAPIPMAIEGRITIHPEFFTEQRFPLDPAGRHVWWPLTPRARIEVRLTRPALTWTGWSYLDTNAGAAPLEDDFERWDWSRTTFDDGAAILYNPTARAQGAKPLALWIANDGRAHTFTPPPDRPLPRTFWGVDRRTQTNLDEPHVIRTFEDSPFYARSLIESALLGRRGVAIHESLLLGRFRSPIVKAMLPFRMPRAYWQTR